MLGQLLQGNQIQQAIHVAARLGIADLLADGPLPVEDLAEAAGAHRGALLRLLRALASVGVFAEDEQGCFRLTPLAELLQDGRLRSFALWSGGVSYRAFGDLEQTVRTGEPAFERLFGVEFFAYLAAHPESGAIFDAMMSRHTAPLATAVAARDFEGVGTLVDVGGGSGELLAAVLRAHTGMCGVLVDQPRVLDGARTLLERAGVADRCTAVAGDVLDAVPPGDGYLLKSVLHGLSDADAARVLAACRRAISPGGRVLLIEFVLASGNAPSPGRIMDLLMLVGCHGRERTAEDFAALLSDAGFRFAGVAPTKHAYSIVEGRA